jgi:folate-dependent phosphoribosylglycinamide formyltransferase PurN
MTPTILFYGDGWLGEAVKELWLTPRAIPYVLPTEYEEGMDIDYVLSAGWKHKISRSERDLARVAALNVHPSPLLSHRFSRYAGKQPVLRQYKDEVEWSAITVHNMNDRFDDGSAVLMRFFSLPQLWDLDQFGDIVRRLLPSVLDCAIIHEAYERAIPE